MDPKEPKKQQQQTMGVERIQRQTAKSKIHCFYANIILEKNPNAFLISWIQNKNFKNRNAFSRTKFSFKTSNLQSHGTHEMAQRSQGQCSKTFSKNVHQNF